MGAQNINIPPKKPSVRVSLDFFPPRLERQTNIEFNSELRTLSQDNDIFADLLEGITLISNHNIEDLRLVNNILESVNNSIAPPKVELIAKNPNYE